LSLLGQLRTTWNQAEYHGFGRRRRFFEGWYFKSVAPSGDAVLAIIPGVSLPDTGEPHAFVQVLDGPNRTSSYHRYDLSEFHAARDRFDIEVGPNRFSLDRIELDLPGKDALRGELRFTGIHPWPVRPLSPGAMGWYSLVPAMECYHGVLSFNHRIEGRLTIAGRATDFTGGKGYVEKDWGRSFPKAWVWIQTNHFAESEASLTVSVAHIPWLGSSFTGCIIGLWLRGRLYRFATYTGTTISKLEVTPQRLVLRVEDRRHVLEVGCHRQEGTILAAPALGAMTGRIAEAITAEIEVCLSRKDHCQASRVFADSGRYAGLEVVGDNSLLETRGQHI